MTAKVLKFQLREADAKRMLTKLAECGSQVFFTDHAKQQMRKRKITPLQVINCLRKGRITEAPCLDLHGNWKLTIERYASGESIGCGVAIDADVPKAIIITAFWVN